MQNAFSEAIEQTVGVLVDAETVVKNDQLIRDEILTYSRGYVEKYEIVRRWEEEWTAPRDNSRGCCPRQAR